MTCLVLSALLTALLNHSVEIPEHIQDCVVLTKYAVDGRYPGLGEALAEDEYQDAMIKAKNVLEWAREII